MVCLVLSLRKRRGEGPEVEDEEEEEDEDPEWQVLQHLTPEQRVAINTLEGEAREGALAQLRVHGTYQTSTTVFPRQQL
jgi:hypothetical protein